MGTYAAELYMPGVTPEQLLDTARRAKSASAEMTAEGTRLTYLSATLLSGDDTCYCLFQGTSEQVVRQANDRAGIPYERVIPAVHLVLQPEIVICMVRGLAAGSGRPGRGAGGVAARRTSGAGARRLLLAG
jgi:Protein of unknown function (DUF4242)